MSIRCSECGSFFLNYESFFDPGDVHPETGTMPLVLCCPDCGEELKRMYVEEDPRSDATKDQT